jgi:hypothetical protein
MKTFIPYTFYKPVIQKAQPLTAADDPLVIYSFTMIHKKYW